ncbi:MAG: DUF4344 domain-containing metallopeptidase [Thermoleophilia bacterium]|nr:DUF4344 domain-containing metallopeptidase [Thermoleophilia bacterium]
MHRLLALLALMFVALLMAGCSADDSSEGAAGFVVEFPGSSEFPDVQDRIRQDRSFDDIAELLNERLLLPEQVTIVVGDDVGADGPSYDPETREILMPIPFVVESRDLLAEEFDLDAATAQELALEGNLHALLHEIGHSLVDVLDLPITGSEEDAVDQLATVVAVNEGAGEVALSGADLFFAESVDPSQLSQVDFWDEHDLDLKGFTATVCLVVGSDPAGYSGIAEEYGLPDEQIEVCEQEWDTAAGSWERLLDDHLR